MQWNPDEFREYSETSSEIDYSNPEYYQPPMPQSPRSAQPVESLDQYPDYTSTAAYGYDPVLMEEYRGPESMDGYTMDAGAEQREAAARGKAESNKRRGRLAGLGGIGATIAALALKFPVLSFALKFGWAGITALVSVALYAFIWGWPFAIGLVALLFIHEMGHALVMKMKGIPVGGLIFVPMLGAAVFMRQMPKNARDEAEVGIAGPIAGAIASAVCLFLAQQSLDTPTIWAPLAYFGFFMNLFNLIPVLPFDGGRVLAAIDRRIWIIGFIGLIAFQVWEWVNGHFSIWLLFFIVMAGTQFWSRRGAPSTPEAQAYYTVPMSARIVLSVLYFGLAAVLVLGMSISHGLIMGLGQ